MLVLHSKAQQNLVINGNFEEYWYCPPILSYDSFPCKNWYSPNRGTPDYFNICMFDSLKNNNYITSISENASIGLGLISVETSSMEHIQSQLSLPLKKLQKYKVSFWVRLNYKFSDYAAYNIGLYFSKNKNVLGDYLISKDNYIEGISPELKAHISNKQEKYLTDTNWIQISGVYTAEGGEKFITIGMFWDEHPKVIELWGNAKNNQSWKNTKRFGKSVKKYLLIKNTFMIDNNTNALVKRGQHFPYYLLDNVSVIPIE